MKTQTVPSGEAERSPRSPQPATEPANGSQDVSDKVVEPFANQTQRPQ